MQTIHLHSFFNRHFHLLSCCPAIALLALPLVGCGGTSTDGGGGMVSATNTWTWMGGSTTLVLENIGYSTPGVYGTLGVPAAENVPGGRFGASSWTDGSGNFWLFGGFGSDSSATGGHLNDVWEFNPSTREWSWMNGSSTQGQPGMYGTLGSPAAGNAPGGRLGASSWTDSAGNVWIFGGLGLDSTGTFGSLNDLWKFNPSTREWTWMSGSSTLVPEQFGFFGRPGVYGTLGVPAAGNVPGSRFGANAWTDRSGNLWLFGGSGYDSNGPAGIGYLNDLWEFNPSISEWAWVGGSDGTGLLGVYGTLGLPAPGNVPGGRVSAASWTDTSGNFWIFGGNGFPLTGLGGDLNSLWQFNVSTREWAWVGGSTMSDQPGVYGTQGSPSAGNVPGGRLSASSWTDVSGNLRLFGGENGPSAFFNDLWEFNPSTSEWTWTAGSSSQNQPGVYGMRGKPASGNVPGARFDASSWIDRSGNLWLFGGEGFDSSGTQGFLNDLWEYQPSH